MPCLSDASRHPLYPLILYSQKHDKDRQEDIPWNRWIANIKNNPEAAHEIVQEAYNEINKQGGIAPYYFYDYEALFKQTLKANDFYIDFSYLEWSDTEIDFSRFAFLYGVSFSHSIFYKSVSFENCEFHKSELDLGERGQDKIRFKSLEYVFGVSPEKLYSCAEFDHTIFMENVYFSGSIFGINAQKKRILHNDTFERNYTSFSEAQFKKRVFFNHCEFNSITSFYMAQFEMTSEFNNIKAYDVLSLNCTFKNNLSLVDIEIGDYLPSVRSLKVDGNLTLMNKNFSASDYEELEKRWWPQFYSDFGLETSLLPSLKDIKFILSRSIKLLLVVFIPLLLIYSYLQTGQISAHLFQDIVFILFISFMFSFTLSMACFLVSSKHTAWNTYKISSQDSPQQNYRAMEEIFSKSSIITSASFAKLRSRASRKDKNLLDSVAIIRWLYCSVSNYGRSIKRPLIALIITPMLFGIISMHQDFPTEKESTKSNISFYHKTLNVINNHRSFIAENIFTTYKHHVVYWIQNAPPVKISLQSDKKNDGAVDNIKTNAFPMAYTLGIFFIKILSLIYSFLIGLALRNYLSINN